MDIDLKFVSENIDFGCASLVYFAIPVKRIE